MPHDATPFALIVRFTVRPGREADFDKLVARTAAGIRAHEPGTLLYSCHIVDGAPRERLFYELYQDKTAFGHHESQPHIRQFLAQRDLLLEATQVNVLTLTDGKPPPVPSALRSAIGSTDSPDD